MEKSNRGDLYIQQVEILGCGNFFYFLQKDVLRKISTEMSTLTTSGNAGGLVDDVERASASARLTCISTFRASV